MSMEKDVSGLKATLAAMESAVAVIQGMLNDITEDVEKQETNMKGARPAKQPGKFMVSFVEPRRQAKKRRRPIIFQTLSSQVIH